MDFYATFVAFPLKLFFILTPFASIAVMLGLTSKLTPADRVRISKRACFIAFCILICAALFGKILFEIFGVSQPSLQVAGGVYLSLLGLDMFRKKHVENSENVSAEKYNDIAVAPLALPLLSGPGTLSFIFVTRPDLTDYIKFLCYCVGLAEAMFFVAVCFILFAKSSSKMTSGFVSICEKLMGIIVCSLGVDITIHGIYNSFM